MAPGGELITSDVSIHGNITRITLKQGLEWISFHPGQSKPHPFYTTRRHLVVVLVAIVVLLVGLLLSMTLGLFTVAM